MYVIEQYSIHTCIGSSDIVSSSLFGGGEDGGGGGGGGVGGVWVGDILNVWRQ